MSWVSNYNKFGANRTPVMQGLSSTDNVTPVPVAVDPATGEILTSGTSTITGDITINGLSGTGFDTTLTLTTANTSYQIPATTPSATYTLLLYNASANDVYITFTSTTTGGILLGAGSNLNIDLGANQAVYGYSATASTTINVSYKEK